MGRVVAAAALLAAIGVSACQVAGPATTTSTSGMTTSLGRLSVGADPTDLIQGATFIDWEDLPRPAQLVHPPDSGFRGVAQVLPGSEARRLLIAVWHSLCMPVVTVSAPEAGSGSQLVIAIRQHPGEECGEALMIWPFEVTLNRDVDPAAVVVEVDDRRPY